LSGGGGATRVLNEGARAVKVGVSEEGTIGGVMNCSSINIENSGCARDGESRCGVTSSLGTLGLVPPDIIYKNEEPQMTK